MTDGNVTENAADVETKLSGCTLKCAMERFNRLDWPMQREWTAGFVKQWRGRLVMDATGVGDPVFDDLRRELPDAEGCRITAQSKRWCRG